MQNIRNILSSTFENIVTTQCKIIKNPIFVISGLTDYFDFFQYQAHIADICTFDEDGNSDFFDKEWFLKILTKLMVASDYSIVSHQQYAYLIENLNSRFFSEGWSYFMIILDPYIHCSKMIISNALLKQVWNSGRKTCLYIRRNNLKLAISITIQLEV